MRIFVAALHRYPGSVGGSGGGRIFDCLVKGLAELGHEVFYMLRMGASVPLPYGGIVVDKPIWDVDIMHCRREFYYPIEARSRGIPSVVTCHTDVGVWGFSREVAQDYWIYITRTLAESYGSNRYVMAAIDTSEFIYSETKEDYFVYIGALGLAMRKGLDITVSLAREMGFRLIVAGSSPDPALVQQTVTYCKENGVEFIGETYGVPKAVLLAGAKALFFPTQLNEAFGQVMAEALVSGTPVICSDFGACPELISPEVGFVCSTDADYRYAVAHVDDIAPQACRAKALQDYHYLRMAQEYVVEYEKEIAVFHNGRG